MLTSSFASRQPEEHQADGALFSAITPATAACRAGRSGGAQGCLLKSSLRKELTDAIRALAAGHRLIPSEIAGELARQVGQESLTVRELQVLELIERGVLEI